MSAKDEALQAIVHVQGLLGGPEMNALGKTLAVAALEHAKECLAQIQEVKRPRAPRKVAPDA